MAVGQTRYMLLAQSLLADIASHRYPLGSLLPTEAELCQQYGVSRHTVREAMRRLQELDVVSRRQGLGTWVKTVPSEMGYTLSAQSVFDVMHYVAETTLVTERILDVVADESLAKQLQCSPGRRWLHVSGYRRLADERALPISCSEIYVNAAYSGVRDLLPSRDSTIYNLIEQHYGEHIVELRQEIKAVPIIGRYAEILQVPPHSPGLHIVRHFLNKNDEPLEISINIHPSERFTYTFRLRRDRRN